MPLVRASFGPFTLDAAARRLTRAGEPVAVPPKALDLLIVLAETPGQVVPKDVLMRRLWPDTFVEDGNLPVAVFTLRKALGDEGDTLIRTVPRHGYALDVEVRVEAPVSAAPALDASRSPVRPADLARPASPWPWRLSLAAAGVLLALGLAYTWRPAPAALTRGIGTVAVLPFAIEGGSDDDPLGTGVAADVAGRLRRLGRVAVRSMGSTLKYGTGAAAVAEAGRALSVDAIVTGVLQRGPDGTHVSAALTRVADGARLWTSADAPLDLLDAAGTVVIGVSPHLAMPDATAAAATLARRVTGDPGAYTEYLTGLGRGAQLTLADVAAARQHFEAALAADPRFVEAHAALAVHLLLPASAVTTPDRTQRAAEAARAVLALDPGHPAGHAARGLTQAFGDHDWDGAGEGLRRAIALAPNEPEFRLWEALRLSALARHDEALHAIDRAVDLDPTSSRVHFYRGFLLLMARRYDDAIDRLRQTPLTLGVVTQQVALGLSLARAKQARYGQAERALARMSSRFSGPQVRTHLAFIKAESGDRATAASLLAEPPVADSARVPRVMTAAVQACMGETDAAFSNLFRAADDGDLRVIFAAVDPALDCARSDPRFATLLAGLGLARAVHH